MKKVLLLTFVLCVTGAAFAQGGYRADVYYRDGTQLTLEGRLAEAASAFEHALALDPSNGNAYYSLGNVYAEMGRWADAVNAYYKAVSLNKDDVEAYNNLGIALAARGQYAQAEAAFERAVKIYPKWAEPYYHLGRVRHALGKEDEAREAHERALRLRPDYAASPPVRFRATAAAKNSSAKNEATPRDGGVLKAMNALNLGGAPGGNASATNASTTAASTTDTNAADTSPTPPAADARPAAPTPAASVPARPAPTDARGYYELGVREGRAGRHKEAVASLRQAVLLDRYNAAAYVALGDAYAATESWPESVDAYEQAARLNPDDADTYQKLGRAFTKLRGARESKVAASEAAQGGGSQPPEAAAEAASPENDPDPTAVYRVGPGDVLDIRLLNRGARPTTTSYEVTPTGLLPYPSLAEPLKVVGLTADQIAARLGAQLKLRAGGADPELAVGVRDYASHAIIVSGMVKEAGTKILQREGVPLYVIIAHAQPQPGAGQALVVSRATGRSTAVDLSDASATRMLVRPGDVITVTRRPEQYVYVSGAVRQPGRKQFNVGLTLTQTIMAAGGALSSQGATNAAVTRQGDDGRLTSTRYSLADIKAGKTPDPLMRPGDRVEVLR
ncbi:MAG TPA: tetratricopeptide repeat protein [Pyrinomonadaceae bacterium]|nr:tetratricopeptide repeat protein [Pyrinomonadaceae bacterium]